MIGTGSQPIMYRSTVHTLSPRLCGCFGGAPSHLQLRSYAFPPQDLHLPRACKRETTSTSGLDDDEPRCFQHVWSLIADFSFCLRPDSSVPDAYAHHCSFCILCISPAIVTAQLGATKSTPIGHTLVARLPPPPNTETSLT